MVLATNFKNIDGFGYQLILNENHTVVGVNLLYNKKILIKKRFERPKMVAKKEDEVKLVLSVVNEFFKS